MINPSPNAVEVRFGETELIVSKTDLKGKITYANRVFMRVSDFSEPQLLGMDHSIIRHPDMPRGVFYGLWKTLKSGTEFFGFVKNITAGGHYYWVFANITPDIVDGRAVGYYSVRRKAPANAITKITELYAQMKSIEARESTANAPKASWEWMTQHIEQELGKGYEESVLSLYEQQ